MAEVCDAAVKLNLKCGMPALMRIFYEEFRMYTLPEMIHRRGDPMAELRKLDETAVKECAEIYIGAYGEAPWDEKYGVEDVERYIMAFLDSDVKCAYILAAGIMFWASRWEW